MRPPIYYEPPFPPLTWNDGWEGEFLLPAYGTTPLVVVAGHGPRAPSAAQARAFTRLLEQSDAIDAAVMDAVLREYPGARQRCLELDVEGAAHAAPPVSTVDELERLIELGTVHVLDDERDDEAYVGFASAAPGTRSTAWG